MSPSVNGPALPAILGSAGSGEHRRRVAAAVLAVAAAAATGFAVPLSAAPSPSPTALPEAPIAFETTSAAEACALSGRGDDAPLPVLLPVGEAAIRDPAALDTLIGCARERSLQVIARIEPPGAWTQAPDPYAAIEPWTRDLERFVQAHRGRIHVYQLGTRPEERFDPVAYAFLVEKVGTILRSIDPECALVMGGMGSGAGAWLEAIPPTRIGPYVDGVALSDPIGLREWMERLARDYPAKPVWLHLEPSDGESLIRRAQAARHAGVGTAFVPAGAAPRDRGLLLELARALPARFVPDPAPPPVSGAGEEGPLAALADPLGPERALVISPGAGAEIALRIGAGPDEVRSVRALRLSDGASTSVRVSQIPDGGVLVEAGPVPGPFLLMFVLVKGPRAEPETIGVTAGYELTAEEIVAGQRAFEAAQARDLRHYTARATLSFHYRAEALNETIDVASVNRFFWKEGVGEYEETDLFINGARWRGPAPAIPFIVPGKIKEVPIEIRLDASYTYHLVGRDTLSGRPCYVIGFEPVDQGRSLYSGRVWIDEETFARHRIHLVQHGLKEPITSNVDDLTYGWVEGPEGRHWLPLEGYRQMTFTVLGRAIVAERLVRWEGFNVNGPDFEARRERAYASGTPILRDDQEGTAYVLQDAGGLRIRRADSMRNVAIFGGMSFSPEEPVGMPFAALNYFDFNWRDSGTQIDIAFAGVLGAIAWTDPALGSSRWELTLEGRFLGLPEKLKRATDKGLRDQEEVKVLEERAWATLGRPLTPFSKGELQIEIGWDDYRRSERTGSGIVFPETGFTTTGTLRWRYQRRGVLLDAWFSDGRRHGWEDWGYPGGLGGNADQDRFRCWGAGLRKALYIGGFQKVSLGAAWYDGRDLDRFSRFRIGEFRSARVRGYNGADITFDRGLTAQIAYQIPLPRGGLALDFNVDAAVIENEEDFTLRTGGAREHVLGGGLGVTFNGPKGTLMGVRAAWGFGSSMDLSGSVASMRFTVVKTFGAWPWGRGSRTEPSPAPSAP